MKKLAIALCLLSSTAFATEAPVCDGVEDCSAKWDAAQLFVVKNSDLKLQTATSVILETYSPRRSSTQIAMRVTKEPIGGGRYKIVAEVFCVNIFGCREPSAKIIERFNAEVSNL